MVEKLFWFVSTKIIGAIHIMPWSGLWAFLNTQLISSALGASVGIIGVYLTIKEDRKKRVEERRQTIKPIIFGTLGKERFNFDNLSDNARAVFPIFDLYQSENGLIKIRQSFKLIVQGINPAKNLRLERFYLSKGNDNSLNFEQVLKVRSAFGGSSQEKHNFDYISKNQENEFTKPPFHVLAGKERNFDVDLVSSKIDKEIFFNDFGAVLEKNDQRLLKVLASDLVPVKAIFSYEDIDGHRYDDLVIDFFIGLKLYPEGQGKNVGFFITDKAPEISGEGSLVDEFINYTEKKDCDNHGKRFNF
ncbi:hypothetical protein [Pediococcus pentosaceus]|uniref:hypothetical protein n=1 Tax=Pediococcus pentosaceus TaxID=1255 RepID=UPI0021A3FC9E|nr:hypothetical protein [Pediococcus pentosaceus]MCT3033270.1 hypothetical protein [Pediococcus pentosaceus]